MASVQDLDRRLEDLIERNTALERENKILREEVALLKQARFGRSTERLEPGQLTLYLGLGDELTPRSTEESTAAAGAPSPKKRNGHGRAPFADHLPRRVIECDVPEEERRCPCCGKEMRLIGEDTSERAEIIPAQVVVNRYVRRKYGCPDGHTVRTAPAPEAVVPGAKYEGSVLAYIATSKYTDHLPLNRLEGILKRQGLHLPKQTMWGMLVRLDELVARPVLRRMHEELLEEPVLQADETPVTLRNESGKGSRKGYAYAWRSVRGMSKSKVLVEFRVDRGRAGPTNFLRDWSGTLVTDGYAGYAEVGRNNRIVRAGCWAHARRKLVKALDAGSRDAAEVLVHVQRLFRLERAIGRRAERDGLDRQGLEALRAAKRATRGRALEQRIHAAAARVHARRPTLPKSKLGKALGYLSNQREPLAVFLSDPRIPIHNNDTERDLRHLAVGRKNWLVFGSERGGDVACRLYSLVLSCRQAGIDPQSYLQDVLAKVSTTPASEIARLTPWGWAKDREQSAVIA